MKQGSGVPSRETSDVEVVDSSTKFVGDMRCIEIPDQGTDDDDTALRWSLLSGRGAPDLAEGLTHCPTVEGMGFVRTESHNPDVGRGGGPTVFSRGAPTPFPRP